MKRIIDENVVYIQSGYDFNMYVLNPITNDFLYQLTISKTDDYKIACEVSEDFDELSEFKVLIKNDNMLYQGFISFVGDDSQIIIQDDLGYSKFGKQVTIKKNDEDIELLFEYTERQTLDEFGIHVINVVYDGRSLVDQQGKDTKKRLYYLCEKLYESFNQFEANYDGLILKKAKKQKVLNPI